MAREERKIQLRVLLKLLCACAFALLYAWGGMELKWLRRFVAPALLSLSMFYFSRDWKVFIQLPVMFLTLSLGYGADTLLAKIFKRMCFGLANGVSSSIHNLIRKNWLLASFQVLLLIEVYFIIGVWNPFPSARAEETFLGLMIALIPMLSIKDKEA
jgi:hypothetical protein